MICSKCGTNNKSGSKFCIKCGNPLATQDTANIQTPEPTILKEKPVQPPPTPQPTSPPSPTQTTPTNQNQITPSVGPFNYIAFIFAVLLKPMTSLEEEKHKLSDAKTSIIFALIISGIITATNFVSTIISLVFSKGYDGKIETNWSTLEYLDFDFYVEIVGKNFLIYACALLVITGVYFLAGLVIKKEPSFARMLGIASVSAVPLVLASMILSPLAINIDPVVGIVVSIVGFVYTLIILLEGMNKELSLESNDLKVYFNLICLSVLIFILYRAYVEFFGSYGLSDWSSFF